MKNEKIIALLIISYIIAGLSLYMSFVDRTNLMIESKTNDNCKGLNLTQTSACLNKELKEFFKYNISNIGKELDESELKEQGGVCKHWSEYYINKFKELGFLGEEIIFWSKDKDRGHDIALVWDEDLDTYCILDQESIIGCGSIIL